MNIFRFRDRVDVLDERSRRFLTTVASLGGYVTPEQARELGIGDSVPRVHVQLKDLESCGFIKRIGSYPVVSKKSNEAEFLSPELGGSAWPRWFRSGDVSRVPVEHAHGRDPDVEGGLPARSGRLTMIEVEHAT